MRVTMDGLGVLWVGVHAGMSYDVEVDTTRSSPEACARLIAAHVTT
jgi:chloramphenicol 3-O-phosphotransferase